MSPLSVIAIPLALIIIGIVLNSIHIVHDQPAYSLENDPANKLAAERQANYHFFFLQRARMLKRQKRTEPRSAISVMTDEHVKEAIQNAQLTSLGTAVNDGDAAVPLGIALRITN